ncbi:GRB2-associated-binding protein 3 isoform X3 [Brienomyrus brachyistius]|uniref:GRB2-associated-binding protein 3 isoform X3 n=1 Tax=Brienomyrus brachyistius TaxID=42636 RepID=UPI0020B2229D|nr:GRB2-associated-binding protein 3 isoform X3 [Brienomyrus brachyistius]
MNICQIMHKEEARLKQAYTSPYRRHLMALETNYDISKQSQQTPQAWRRRWFVLRRGRMSGNPDVLEYYRSKSAKKPIRTIDLRECEVQMPADLQLIKRNFQNQHLFLVKTSSRIFYLVAKTEDEMKNWIRNISQICHFEILNDSADSLDSAQQHSPAQSPGTLHTVSADLPPNADAPDVNCSDSESSPPLDYLFLSQCKTGKVPMTRCNSCSNSDRSIECSSSENTFEDFPSSPLCLNPFSPSLPVAPTEPPLSASSSILSQSCHPFPDVFKFDTLSSGLMLNGFMDSFTPPPRPPKPSQYNLESACHVTVSRRTSLVGLDHFRRGEFEGNSLKSLNKRLSLNLPSLLTVHSPQWIDCNEDSYVPMDSRVSSPVSTLDNSSDGYIPMSPTSVSLTSSNRSETPPPIVPLRGLPYEVDPPPVNRKLKPRMRARPPPLDLRSLSTIRESETHLPLTRTRTEPSFAHRLPLNNEAAMTGPPGSLDNSCLSKGLNQHFFPTNGNAVLPWLRRASLDYLSLDFNSASPSPVQMKPIFADEDRVDYVQVDEQKTQALQNTKMEWKDVRQSKV